MNLGTRLDPCESRQGLQDLPCKALKAAMAILIGVAVPSTTPGNGNTAIASSAAALKVEAALSSTNIETTSSCTGNDHVIFDASLHKPSTCNAKGKGKEAREQGSATAQNDKSKGLEPGRCREQLVL